MPAWVGKVPYANSRNASWGYPTDCSGFEQWLDLAKLLSWVSGMAHFQTSALSLAETLPESLAEKVVPRWDKVKADPWWARRPQPGKMIRVHQVGGFIGFGGVFRKPPEVGRRKRDVQENLRTSFF